MTSWIEKLGGETPAQPKNRQSDELAESYASMSFELILEEAITATARKAGLFREKNKMGTGIFFKKRKSSPSPFWCRSHNVKYRLYFPG